MEEPINKEHAAQAAKELNNLRQRFREYRDLERTIKRVLKKDIPDAEKLIRIDALTND